jgi:hypothetical protein
MKFTTKCEEGAIIRRYVDLPKLFHLLLSRRLFFPSLGLLRKRDPFECATFPPGRYSRLSQPTLKTRARELADLLPERLCHRERNRPAATADYLALVEETPRAELEKCVWELERGKLLERVVCSCWYEGESESEAMWKLYANQHGVAIESTVKQLKASIKEGYPDAWNIQPDPAFEQCYTVAKVKYVDTSKGSIPPFYCQNPWMLKRASFGHESEIRISHEVDHRISLLDGGVNVEVDVENLVNRIVIGPFLSQQTWVPIGSAIETIVKGIKTRPPKIRVERSQLLSAPSYENKIFETLSWKTVESLIGLF